MKNIVQLVNIVCTRVADMGHAITNLDVNVHRRNPIGLLFQADCEVHHSSNVALAGCQCGGGGEQEGSPRQSFDTLALQIQQAPCIFESDAGLRGIPCY